MNALFRMILLAALICDPCPVPAQTEAATVIPANLAASPVGEYITVEGVVAKIFTSKSGNTFLNIGAAYPNQTFTGWIPPASPVSKSLILPAIEGKHVIITGRIENKPMVPEMIVLAADVLLCDLVQEGEALCLIQF
jgi:hypothetical protein